MPSRPSLLVLMTQPRSKLLVFVLAHLLPALLDYAPHSGPRHLKFNILIYHFRETVSKHSIENLRPAMSAVTSTTPGHRSVHLSPKHSVTQDKIVCAGML